MIEKRSKCNNLVATASILELARVEARTAAKEVVNLTRLDVVGEAGDEESVDGVAVFGVLNGRWLLVVEVVRFVRRVSHSLGVAAVLVFVAVAEVLAVLVDSL